MKRVLTTTADLVEAGLVAPEAAADLQAVGARYAIGITAEMATLIRQQGAEGPVGRQFIPDVAELATLPDEDADPIGDHAHEPVKGLVHRYPDRVLLKLLHVCPVYCRFCFRREMVGPQGDGTLSADEITSAISYISGHSEIWEVIFTGGDPLMLSPRRLQEVLSALSDVPHLGAVRFHSRVPVTDPARIDPSLIEALLASGKAVTVAIHANHPDEFTPAAVLAIRRLADAGISLISQSVLLRGINDDVSVLVLLMRRFVECGVRPYYLHHPDLAPGTSHFRLPIATGQALVRQLRGRISGLCQPTYVLDIPGGHGKVPLLGPDVVGVDGGYRLTDWQGRQHFYRDDQA